MCILEEMVTAIAGVAGAIAKSFAAIGNLVKHYGGMDAQRSKMNLSFEDVSAGK